MNGKYFFMPVFLLSIHLGMGQPVTGVWHGKVGSGLRSTQIELKLIRQGDSLTGTSYYYNSPTQYARFRVSGYFDREGDIIWQDEELIESRGNFTKNSRPATYYFNTSFNCPGENIMKLEGSAALTGEDGKKAFPVTLNKVEYPRFPDEWDEVIADFPYYASVPGLIDSIARSGKISNAPEPVAVAVAASPAGPYQKPELKTISPPAEERKAVPVQEKRPLTPEEKFTARKKILTAEIPVSGDSITLNFYDNAEIDGDSIALFLNGKMLWQHILLKAEPFTFKIPVPELNNENELIMVAENLGSIPPNTSLMIAWVNGQRYEARLESTENSSAMIRFVKPPELSGANR